MNQDSARTPLQHAILSTLLYYDIWHYPLTGSELYAFLPVNSISYEEFTQLLKDKGPGNEVGEQYGYYFIRNSGSGVVDTRKHKQKHAEGLWRMARVSMHVIKRFPFVRAIFVSGDLSKNATDKKSDVDFFIVTSSGKLWLTRTFLILFKKIFLLNSKKYFCLNHFITEDHLHLDEQNVFLATEIAHLKPLYNTEMFRRYMQENVWIKTYFPNFDCDRLEFPEASNRPSILQRIFEACLSILPTEAIDAYLLRSMQNVWKKRYPEFEDSTRNRILRSTRDESRAHIGDFQDKILNQYQGKLHQFDIAL